MPLMRSCRRAAIKFDQIHDWVPRSRDVVEPVAILDQFTDEWIDLAQRQRRLRAALQITAHEAIFAHTQFQRSSASLIDSRTTVLLGQPQHTHDAAHSRLGLTPVSALCLSQWSK